MRIEKGEVSGCFDTGRQAPGYARGLRLVPGPWSCHGKAAAWSKYSGVILKFPGFDSLVY